MKLLKILLFLSAVWATTINVPDDYSTIQEGIDAAVGGDTVLVFPGMYYGPIDFEGKNLVIGSLYLIEADESYIDETIIMSTNPNVSHLIQII